MFRESFEAAVVGRYSSRAENSDAHISESGKFNYESTKRDASRGLSSLCRALVSLQCKPGGCLPVECAGPLDSFDAQFASIAGILDHFGEGLRNFRLAEWKIGRASCRESV